jgi:hypothetical protein
MITTTSPPPMITQHFSSSLLSIPIPGDNLERLWRIYSYIKKKLIHKSFHDTIWKQECNQLEQEFLELYERTQIKEKDTKTKTKNKTKEPFYRFKITNRSHENIFDGLRYKY